MKSKTPCSKTGQNIFAQYILPMRNEVPGNRVYIPPFRGGYIYTPSAQYSSHYPKPLRIPTSAQCPRLQAAPASPGARRIDFQAGSNQRKQGPGAEARAAQHTTIFGQSRACVYLYPVACVFVQRSAGLSCRVSGCRAACPPDGGPLQRETTGGVGGLT